MDKKQRCHNPNDRGVVHVDCCVDEQVRSWDRAEMFGSCVSDDLVGSYASSSGEEEGSGDSEELSSEECEAPAVNRLSEGMFAGALCPCWISTSGALRILFSAVVPGNTAPPWGVPLLLYGDPPYPVVALPYGCGEFGAFTVPVCRLGGWLETTCACGGGGGLRMQK